MGFVARAHRFSAPVLRAPDHARGFTLLEILVVITIIAFASALAVMSIAPDQRGTIARESKRFAGTLEYLAQRAQWRNETLGVSAQGPLIRYWKHAADEDRWLRIDDDDVLREQSLPDEYGARALRFAGQPVDPDVILPMRASGRNEPLAVLIRSQQWEAVVTMDPLNRVAIDGPRATGP